MKKREREEKNKLFGLWIRELRELRVKADKL